MKILAGILILVSVVSAFDLINTRHGRHHHGTRHHRHRHHRHGHRHHGHNRDKGDYAEEDYDAGEDYGGEFTVHKTCRRSGMVALTFDDGVV